MRWGSTLRLTFLAELRLIMCCRPLQPTWIVMSCTCHPAIHSGAQEMEWLSVVGCYQMCA